MSFDILFHTCNLGTRKKRVKNPFTGAAMSVFDDPGLTDDERGAVVNLLKELKAEGPDDFGFYRLSFPDGGEADLSADGLSDRKKFDSCSVETRGLTPGVARFLFRLSRAGNMVLIPVAEGVGELVTSEEQRHRVVARFPEAKVVRSAKALETEVRRGFDAWEQYRDEVAGDKG